MSGRTVVVGDVHGCLEELEALLELCELEAGDSLVFVGDLVAKGPDSAGVLALAMERGARAVRGNHDQHCLDACALIEEGRGEEVKKARRALSTSLSDAAVEWLAATPLFLRLPEHGALVVHGGLVAGKPIEEQPGDLLMNMRSLRADGTPSKRIEDGEPWAARWEGPELAIFGHDAIRGLQQHPHAVGLDTGCVYGGSLSALVLPARELLQVPAKRVYVEPAGPRVERG